MRIFHLDEAREMLNVQVVLGDPLANNVKPLMVGGYCDQPPIFTRWPRD